MTIFLAQYDRATGKLVKLSAFKGTERQRAQEARLDLELQLLGRVDHEVVLLEAESEGALRKTHRRYFEDLSELAATART